jgi:LPS sulfotransferase NodH
MSGESHVATPNLDRLAADGIAFDNAYCPSPICTPSRMAMLTACHPRTQDCWTNDDFLASDRPTMAHALGAAGYTPTLIGRMHSLGPDQLHGYVVREIGDHSPNWIGVPRHDMGVLANTNDPGRDSVVKAAPLLDFLFHRGYTLPMTVTRYNELQLSSELLDRPPCPVRAKVFICSTPRTGSFLLCRAMIHHGIGIPHEYFHSMHAGIIGPRLGIGALRNGGLLKSESELRRAYITALMARRTNNGIFSAKVQWWEFEQNLDNPEGLELLQNAHFIHLYRENLLDQAISLHIARQTGRWGFDELVTTPPAPNPQFFDNRAINNNLDLVARHDMNWRMFFARNRITPLMISYERLRDDVAGVLRTIVEVFGLEVPINDFDYVEERPSNARHPQVPPSSELKAEFLRAHQRVMPARSSRMDGAEGSDAATATLDPSALR